MSGRPQDAAARLHSDGIVAPDEDHAADMTVDVVDDVGHFVPEEAPDLVVDLIRSTR
jgi:pimeloyl-ACP methyl ester carboxylesterase